MTSANTAGTLATAVSPSGVRLTSTTRRSSSERSRAQKPFFHQPVEQARPGASIGVGATRQIGNGRLPLLPHTLQRHPSGTGEVHRGQTVGGLDMAKDRIQKSGSHELICLGNCFHVKEFEPIPVGHCSVSPSAAAEKKAPMGPFQQGQPVPWSESTLVRALAGVLFRTGRDTTLQADALATARRGEGHAVERRWTRGALAVSFGDDFVAHDSSREKG
jgi:hypothetical protein